MKVGKITALALTAFGALPVMAQTEKDTLHTDSHFFYQELNRLENMYEGTENPVAFSYNRVQNIADAQVGAYLNNGGLHAIDEGRKGQTYAASINGLQRFGKLSVSGFFEYRNAKDYDVKWNSTLFVTPTNPFILGDHVESTANSEIFRMSAAVSYQFNRHLTGALSLRYKTGSRSDQTDPRPKTDAMHFVVNPGVEYRINPVHSLGAAFTADLFRSDMNHTVINSNNNHVYYVMKGMGDYMTRTSSDMASLPRDYKGNRFAGSLQWLITPASGKVRNRIEAVYSHNKEVAEDGGYAFTFKAGDYYRTDITVSDRLSLRHSDRFEQNFTVSVNYASDSGDWYDQKKIVDTQHGNLAYYQILNKSTIRESKYLTARFGYQADLLRDGMPAYTFNAGVQFDRADMTQYYTRAFKQNYNTLTVDLSATGNWKAGKVRLSGKAGGYYKALLGDATYDCPRPDMSENYAAPVFEYATASQAGFQAQAAAFLPLTIYKYHTWMGLTVRAASSFYMGDNKYSAVYDSVSRTFVDAAFTVRF